MTDTKRPQITGRVDGSLRDRIAAVIADYLRGELNWGDDLSPHLADAVIASLGLKQQNRYGFHRCVSEWTPDD